MNRRQIMNRKEKELYKVTIDYVNDYGNNVNEIVYMRLTEGEKNLLYWLEDVSVVRGVDLYAVDEVEIVEF